MTEAEDLSNKIKGIKNYLNYFPEDTLAKENLIKYTYLNELGLEEEDFPLEHVVGNHLSLNSQIVVGKKDSLKNWELFNSKKPTQDQCAKNDCRFIVSDGNRVYMALYDYIAYEFVKWDEPKLYDKTIIKWQELPEL